MDMKKSSEFLDSELAIVIMATFAINAISKYIKYNPYQAVVKKQFL